MHEPSGASQVPSLAPCVRQSRLRIFYTVAASQANERGRRGGLPITPARDTHFSPRVCNAVPHAFPLVDGASRLGSARAGGFPLIVLARVRERHRERADLRSRCRPETSRASATAGSVSTTRSTSAVLAQATARPDGVYILSLKTLVVPKPADAYRLVSRFKARRTAFAAREAPR